MGKYTKYLKPRYSVPILFIGISILFFFFRLYKLTSVPPHLHVDEISFGYNAYSLLKTGKDEYGVFLPFILRSFDDYRSAVLSYVMIPFIQFFGLTIFTLRITTVFISFVTLLSLYSITLSLLNLGNAKKNVLSQNGEKYCALSAAFLYAVSPWSIFVSRIAIDTNLSLALFSAGFAFFLHYIIKKRVWNLYASFILFSATLYAYNGIKLFLPFFMFLTIILFSKEILKKKMHFIFAVVVSVLLLLPLLNAARSHDNLSRFTYLNYLTQKESTILSLSSQRLVYDRANHNILGGVFDNRRFAWFPFSLTNYLSNINPTWLYADDEINIKYKVPGFGLFYILELPLLFVGLYFLTEKKVFSKKILILLGVWFATAIIPAGMTIDTPNAVRIYPMLLVFLIIEAIGLYFIAKNIYEEKNLYKKILLSCIILGIGAFSLLWFFSSYFYNFPREYSHLYHYGESEAVLYARAHEKEYKHILVSNRGDLTFSYIYYLFLNRYDPKKFLAQGGTKSGNFFADHTIGKYVFLNPNISIDKDGITIINPAFIDNLDKNTLYILDKSDLPKEENIKYDLLQKLRILKIIKYLNGEDAVFILKSV